jgi:Holliday junction resolvase RusA-like endonuclease
MAEILFKCTIPGRVAIKKNSLQRRYSFAKQRTVTMASDRYLDWAEMASLHIRQAMRGARTIVVPVNIKMLFYFLNHSSEADLSNLYQGPEDILQEMGVIKNDKLIYGHDGSRKIFGSNPRVEIEITRFTELDLASSD